MTALSRLALRLLIGAAFLLAPVLIAAGRVDVRGAWIWVFVIWVSAVSIYGRLLRVSPGLVAERFHPPSDRDAATRRLVLLPILAHLVIAGLDARFGWSNVPLWGQIVGLSIVAAGFAITGWVLLTNPFASSAVRIQDEREHIVIARGPYALVRHPMYFATLLVCVSSGIALGSWWAGVALVPVVALFIRRTAVEDSMLQRELEGYSAYAKRVPWRVVPFVF